MDIFNFFCICGIIMLYFCYVSPRQMRRLISLPENFLIHNNIGINSLELQSVIYMSFHLNVPAKISHHTLFLDCIFWATIFGIFHQVIGPLILLGWAFFQGLSFHEPKYHKILMVFWLLCIIIAIPLINLKNGYYIASNGLCINSVLKAIGHVTEPIPPGLFATNFQHILKLPQNPKTYIRLFLSFIIGFVAEFLSGLPYRLPSIWLYLCLLNCGFEFSRNSMENLKYQAYKTHREKVAWKALPKLKTY